MTEAVQTALIVAVPPTLASIASIVMAFKAKTKAEATHLLINSRMEELLRVSKIASHLEGKTEGIAEERKSPNKK